MIGRTAEIDIEKLYDVVVSPETWPHLLHDIARSANAVGTCLAADHGRATLVARPVSPDLTAPIDDFLNSGWYKRDLRGQRAWPLLRQGRKVLVEHDISSEDERRHSDYHNEWLRPWDLPWWGTLGFSLEGQHYGLVFLRNSKQGAFTHEEMHRLHGLQADLGRVLSLIDLLSIKQAEGMLDGFDLVEKPAFLLNASGRVIRFNAHAKPLLQTDFALSHGALRTAHPQSNERLQKLIATALTAGISASRTEPHWIAVERPARRPLIVNALPVMGGLADILTGARVVLTVNDLEHKRLPPPDMLWAVFGLTPAESRLAMRLAAGEDLSLAAEALGLSAGTVRGYLKTIFAKTDTHRQSELLQLIARMGGI
ncbi:helix-turn-helix transcriptional regulator [Bosea sp. BK604]|uniref:helix-turn-helix transcriptional regulator n=1 Tax=Bosea sp. BK604 TaxID=2512180 RepID=UPI00104D0A39|nr:helix-turn-helix transcriptional regulator [Bosea sp. BK604]TCR65727.1 DNA-binding CsgD family transcriptional regulator [Bosea sp. BK604]